ncbi:Molybdopterin molybdotransferase [Altererythrobacter insulae]|nr:Molybdopterin molybdotransferase [Altererythrobacter insulae]
MGAMLTLEEAQNRVLALAPPMPIENIACEKAVGRYLAMDLIARRTQPPADLSAMDGYAIGGDGTGPWNLVGESRAGTPFDRSLADGETIRISTGAHMPAGADRVLIQENVAVEGSAVSCFQDFPNALRHVRQRGFDFDEGDVILSRGVQIGPAQLALAIGAGHREIPVHRAPTIAIIDSGDELAKDPATCRDDQIPASNGAMIAAMLAELGCETVRLGPVQDDRDALASALGQAEACDIVVTTGGASVGDHDLMRPALEAWGADLDFWKVAMKPGKPIMVASRDKQVIFGLPGNPVSSFVTCYLFVLPLVRAALGDAAPLPQSVLLEAGCNLPPVGSRREFLRSYWDGTTVKLVDSQDSSALAALAQANCLIDRPAHSDQIEAGTSVPCLLLKNG